MVQTPVRPPKVDTDTLARDYIQSLCEGVFPDDRPEFGDWEQTISNLESAFLKVERKGGNISEAMTNVLQTLYKHDKALADLMTPAPSIDDIEMPSDASFPPLPEQVQLDPSLARGACKYLEIYEAFSREASPEGFDDYHPFAGVWSLSVANARRSYLPLKRKRIFGNVMLAFCGDTSLFAKSTTAYVAKDVLIASGLGYLIGPDRTSPAKLLSDMSGSRIPVDYATLSIEKQESVKKRLAMSGQKGLYFDELGKFIQKMLAKGSTTSDFAELFLSLDACPDTYETSTIARSSEPIQKPYLPLLGAMTPANLKENAKSGADFWTDGFWARFGFLAAPPDQYEDSPLDAEELPIPGELTTALREWHKRLGVPQCYVTEIVDEKTGNKTGQHAIEREDLPETACTISQDAWHAWARYRSALKRMLKDFPHKDFHGSYTRLPETALRMAVLMASLENDNRIELKHWAKAQELAEILRKNLHELYRQVNSHDYVSESAKLEEGIIDKLRTFKEKGAEPAITIAQLKNRYYKNTSTKMLIDVMDSLTKAGLLRKEKTGHAKEGKYFLID